MLSSDPRPRSCLDGGGLVEGEVALAVEHPGGDELEPVGDVLVVIQQLADVGVGGEAGGVAAVAAAGPAYLAEGDRVGAGLGDRVPAVAQRAKVRQQQPVLLTVARSWAVAMIRTACGLAPAMCAWPAERTWAGRPKSSVAFVRYFAR